MNQIFEVLLSTMDQNSLSLIKKMNINSDLVVVNQCFCEGILETEINGNIIRYINTKEKGLSRSRNMAIKNSSADICLLSDDDVIYINGYMNLICQEFLNNPDFQILAFRLEGIDQVFKNYSKKEREIGYLQSMKISSVEIAFKRSAILGKRIFFDERFGSGARYKSGEENIFLFECLKKGLKIKYIPQKIGTIVVGNSTWFTGYSKEYFVAKDIL